MHLPCVLSCVLSSCSGIDLSPFQETVFFLKKPFTYEYGNIRILQHMKVNRRVIALEKASQQEAAEEAARVAEEERLARVLQDEEERLRNSATGRLSNAASGAFRRVTGLWGSKGGGKTDNDGRDNPQLDTNEENDTYEDDDYDDENNNFENNNDDDENPDDNGDRDDANNVEERSLPSTDENADNSNDNNTNDNNTNDSKTHFKAAKALKFWGK